MTTPLEEAVARAIDPSAWEPLPFNVSGHMYERTRIKDRIKRRDISLRKAKAAIEAYERVKSDEELKAFSDALAGKQQPLDRGFHKVLTDNSFELYEKAKLDDEYCSYDNIRNVPGEPNCRILYYVVAKETGNPALCIGSILTGINVPSYGLLCDGRRISKDEYPELVEVIGGDILPLLMQPKEKAKEGGG